MSDGHHSGVSQVIIQVVKMYLHPAARLIIQSSGGPFRSSLTKLTFPEICLMNKYGALFIFNCVQEDENAFQILKWCSNRHIY